MAESLVNAIKIDPSTSIFSRTNLTTALVGIVAFFIARLVIELMLLQQRRSVNSSRTNSSVNAAAALQLPPGPLLTLPIVGYLPALLNGGLSYHTIHKFAKQFGPVYGVKTGARYLVIINDARLVRQALKSTELSGRPPNYKSAFSNPNQDGIVDQSYTDDWRVLHNFTARVLKRSFSSHNPLLLDLAVREALHLSYFLKYRTSPGLASPLEPQQTPATLDPDQIIISAMCNIALNMLVGKRFDYTHEENQTLVTLLRLSFETLISCGEYDMFPVLQKLYPKSDTLKKHERVYQTVDKYMMDHIERVRLEIRQKMRRHKLSHQINILNDNEDDDWAAAIENNEPESFAEAFLLEQQRLKLEQKSSAAIASATKAKTTDASSSASHAANKIFTDSHLMHTLFDFMGAASQTTASALRWTLVQLAADDALQDRMRKLVGEYVRPADVQFILNEWNRLPATATAAVASNDDETLSLHERVSAQLLEVTQCARMQAFFNEILRRYNVTPLGLPHYSMQPFVLTTDEQQKFLIPANTDLFVNLYNVHNDAKYWDAPETFNMDRFLERSATSNGSSQTGGELKLKKHEAFMPFGLGPRMCMGEQLARFEFGIFLAVLLSVFEIDFEDSTVRSSGEWANGIMQITHEPQSWKLNFTVMNNYAQNYEQTTF